MWRFLNATVALLVLISSDVAAQSADVFLDVESTSARTNPEWWVASPDSTLRTVRRRLARIDLGRIAAMRDFGAAPGGQSQELVLNLFDDTVFRALVEQRAETDTGYVLTGRLDGVPFGTVALAVDGPVVAGTVRTPTATWRIRSVGAGLHVIREVDLTTLPPDAQFPIPSLRGETRESEEARAGVVIAPSDPIPIPPPNQDDGSVIDVLVVYTPAARRGEGGTAEIQALINLMVAETNQAYAKSGVTQRINLVHQGEVAYVEEGGWNDDLFRLWNSVDGYMDEVHELRDAYAADLVHLIYEVGGGYCGLTATAGPAEVIETWLTPFAITGRDCGPITFAHELGHNMGLKHDRYMDRSNYPYPYSHGYVNQRAFQAGAPESSRWYTVMAYPNQCHDWFRCHPLFRFSNPAQRWHGDPLGVPGDEPSDAVDGPADARRHLNSTRQIVARFRSSIDRYTCRPVLSPGADWNVVPAAGGTYSLTVTIASGCFWTAATTAEFVTVTGGESGIGSGVVSYGVASNGGAVRSARLRIAGHPVGWEWASPAAEVQIDQLSAPGQRAPGVCDRTVEVLKEITRRARVDHCWEVTEEWQLMGIDELDLRGRGVTSLKVGDFAGLSGLNDLWLDHNFLTTLPPGVFEGLPTLDSPNLSNNALASLSPQTFADLPNLGILDLKNNHLRLQPYLFAGMTNLHWLLLDDNELSELPAGVFEGLSNLKLLSLSGNHFINIPAGIFAELSNLETLWLSGNRMTNIRAGIFAGLSNLEKLSLGGNRLTTLPESVFASLASLAFLDLARNQLTRLPAKLFAGITGVRLIWLFGNELAALPPGIFSGLSNLSGLELDQNPGTPFPLTLELVRTQSTPEGGAVAVRVVEGVPFDVSLRLAATGGTLSANTATIGAGSTVGENVRVTRRESTVTVRPGPAPPIPAGSGCGLARCFTGLRLVVGAPVVFSADDN